MTTAPSTIDVTCPTCNEPYHVSPNHIGKNLKCGKCDQIFEINADGAAARARGYGGEAPAGPAKPANDARGPGSAASPAGPGLCPGHPIAVSDSDFSRTVLQSPTPVLVDFWATWCPPCRAIAPSLDQLATEYAGRITIAKLNADENPRTMMQYGVQGLPTLLIFKNGQEVDRLVGLRPKPAIKQALDRSLAA